MRASECTGRPGSPDGRSRPPSRQHGVWRPSASSGVVHQSVASRMMRTTRGQRTAAGRCDTAADARRHRSRPSHRRATASAWMSSGRTGSRTCGAAAGALMGERIAAVFDFLDLVRLLQDGLVGARTSPRAGSRPCSSSSASDTKSAKKRSSRGISRSRKRRHSVPPTPLAAHSTARAVEGLTVHELRSRRSRASSAS